MKVKIFCTQSLANANHRLNEEDVEVKMEDTVADLKVKITMIYTNLSPDSFQLYLNRRTAISDDEKMIDLMKKGEGEQ